MKIPTIFQKNVLNLSLVIDSPIMEGIKYFKVKINGTTCMIKDGIPYCKYDIKLFRIKNNERIYLTKEELDNKIPVDSISCEEPDFLSGHWPHWVKLSKANPNHKYILEAYDNLLIKDIDGTYEAIGPKIQGNLHNEDYHIMIPHFAKELDVKINMEDYTLDPFRYFQIALEDFNWEGLIAYNEKDEPIGQIRRSHFGHKPIKYHKATELFLV